MSEWKNEHSFPRLTSFTNNVYVDYCRNIVWTKTGNGSFYSFAALLHRRYNLLCYIFDINGKRRNVSTLSKYLLIYLSI